MMGSSMQNGNIPAEIEAELQHAKQWCKQKKVEIIKESTDSNMPDPRWMFAN